MQLTSGNFQGYFASKTDTQGNKLTSTPNLQAEQYIVTSLFFARHRWGDSQGIYNYSN